VATNSTATIPQTATVVTTRIVVESPVLMTSSGRGTSVLLAVLNPVCARIASRTLPVSL
jgi:hypothetical protein